MCRGKHVEFILMETGNLNYDLNLDRNFGRPVSMTIRSEKLDFKPIINIKNMDFPISLGGRQADAEIYFLLYNVIFDGSSINANLPDGYTMNEGSNEPASLFSIKAAKKFFAVVPFYFHEHIR